MFEDDQGILNERFGDRKAPAEHERASRRKRKKVVVWNKWLGCISVEKDDSYTGDKEEDKPPVKTLACKIVIFLISIFHIVP